MKKILLLSLFIICLTFDVSAMSLKPSCPNSVYLGDTFDVNITLTRSNEEVVVSGVDGLFKYDSTKIELKSQTVFSSNWTPLSTVANNKKFSFVNMSFNEVIESTTKDVVKMKFTANTLGSTTITVQDPNATDGEGKLVSISGGSCAFTVREPLSDINTLSDIKINGTSISGFNANTISYSRNVGDLDSITIAVTKTDSKSTVTGDVGTKTLKYGTNTFKITVTSESGLHKVYTLTITREDARSSVNTLKTLTLSAGTINFNPNTTTYNVSVSNKVESIVISSTLTDSKSSYVEGFGNREMALKEGLNTILIKVKSEKGDVRTYTLNITRSGKSSVNTLRTLTLSAGTINFNPTTYTYNVTVPNNTISITISSTLTDNTSSYMNGYGNRTVSLEEGMNTIQIKVKAENDEVRTYTLNVTRLGKSSVNTLKTLTLSAGTITFKPTTTTYDLTVAYKVEDITISSTLTDTSSRYVEGFGNRKVSLEVGKNTFLIKVQAENGDIRTYTLNITRKSNKSEVNTLKTLTVSDTKFNFKSTTTTYNLTVAKTVTKVKITSTLTDDKSSYVTGYGNREVTLKEGKNVVLIKVKAESGDIKTYTLNITRESDKSTINTLKSLKIDKIKFDFNENTFEYDLTVDKSITKIKITSELKDKKASYVTGYGDREVTLKEGLNEVLIKVKSEFGEENIYKLNIVCGNEGYTNAGVKDIKVTNYDLNFDKDKNEYTITIKDETKLKLSVELENPNATYEISGNENLKNGSTVLIKVTAEDKKTTKEYRINIVKDIVSEEKEETEEKGDSMVTWIVCISVFVIGLVILIKAIPRG